jgi:adenylate cyclase
MDCLTAAVMDHDGLVVDYYGDGLAAMWNAPAVQFEHPELACRAALRMLETLPDVAADWAGVLGAELRLGIGIHTGIVHVGNAGSRRRTKYGPRGANVHLTSRLEAATKEIGVPLLVSQHTAARLSNRFTTTRICQAQMPGVTEPTSLFTIRHATTDPLVLAQLFDYRCALELYEQGQCADAAECLAKIDAASPHVPARFLAQQIEETLGQQQRRRSTDEATPRAFPVITLNPK